MSWPPIEPVMAWAYRHTGLRGAALCEFTLWVWRGVVMRNGKLQGPPYVYPYADEGYEAPLSALRAETHDG